VKLFDDLCTLVSQCVVFVDEHFSEVLHWCGGASALFNVGVTDVREFSAFESGHDIAGKAAFLLSGVIDESVLDIIQAIVSASNFSHVIVFTSLSPAMHCVYEYGTTAAVEDDSKAFVTYRRQILDWMEVKQTARCVVDIQYIPLVAASIVPSLFVLPSHSKLFPILPTDFQYIPCKEDSHTQNQQVEIEFSRLPKNLQLQIKLLVCSLNSLLEVLNCSEDIYALGTTSNIVASELASLSWSKQRRKTASCRASLLLVDRTLDISSAVWHGQDSLLDKIFALLPRLAGHSSEVSVNMAPICAGTSNPNYVVVAPGCLGHPDDPSAMNLLNTLAVLKHKEALLEVNRLLVDAVAKEALAAEITSNTSSARGKVTLKQLESQVQLFRCKVKSIRKCSGLLQLALAVIQTLNHSSNSKFDTLHGVEKGLIQCQDENSSLRAIDLLHETVDKQMALPLNERFLSADDLLLLLAYVYSLTGDFDSVSLKEEAILKTTLCELALNECNDSSIISEIITNEKSEKKRLLAAQHILEKLKGLSNARQGLKKYKNIYEPGTLSAPPKFQPLLKQVIVDILDPSKPELVDITNKSSGFGDLLKSGFGLFRAVSKPRPSDHPLMVIFVIGGITAAEVRQVREAVTLSKSNVQIMVGSTRLVNPADVLRMILTQDNLCL
jgi:hypothetical protein